MIPLIIKIGLLIVSTVHFVVSCEHLWPQAEYRRGVRIAAGLPSDSKASPKRFEMQNAARADNKDAVILAHTSRQGMKNEREA